MIVKVLKTRISVQERVIGLLNPFLALQQDESL